MQTSTRNQRGKDECVSEVGGDSRDGREVKDLIRLQLATDERGVVNEVSVGDCYAFGGAGGT